MCVCVCVYIYVCVCVCVRVYIYNQLGSRKNGLRIKSNVNAYFGGFNSIQENII